MRKTILYIAMSLDGYIADSNGNVGWLGGQGNQEETVDTYSVFVNRVDTVVMGWNTYHQIITELSPDEWVYEGLTSYIITHRDLPSTDHIKFVQDSPCSLVKKLRREQGKAIWICGGGTIIQPLIRENLIDEYDIAIMPIILGSGIRLFEGDSSEIKLKLERAQSYNGITEVVYVRR